MHAQLSAKEEQQNIAATRETRPIPRLTPLKFPRRNGQKINKSEMQVSALEVDSDPAAADLFIHVLNALTCPLDQKLRAFKMHTKVGARSSILSYAVSYIKCLCRNLYPR